LHGLIHLNVVRAGVVRHPSEWRWCGHDELIRERTRYRLIDRDALTKLLGPGLRDDFEQAYRREIADAIARRKLEREPWWTESIAVGSEDFIPRVKAQTLYRRRLDISQAVDGVWVIREVAPAPGARG